jgi:hypothetical protein
MRLPYPQNLLHRLVIGLPEIPISGWRALGGAGLLGAAIAIALNHPWVGAPLLLLGALAAIAGEAFVRQEHKRPAPVLTLGLLAVLFCFGLAEPSRALPAMFLMFALTGMTLLEGRLVVAVTGLTVVAFLAACILPSSFSLSAYIIGILAFIAAGQGVAKDWS